jgi:5-formaminoimidazole-4-carboxamide-1-(beta)-D-ribofuranosyl 5'-monophosphate synthetase
MQRILDDYDPRRITVATLCSHSSMQIFDGARKEGFKTLGISVGPRPRFYDAYPRAKPDSFLELGSMDEMKDKASDLVAQNVVIVPHGSFVEYMGVDKFLKLPVPSFGNKKVLQWEADRAREYEWLKDAGVPLPQAVEDPRDIIAPVIVKYDGAKGGRGFFVAKNYHEFMRKVDKTQRYHIQEFVLGTRYYLHYFYSPLVHEGYKVRNGSLQMLSIDRRDESNIDELNRLGSIAELEEVGIPPTFVVTGNIPMVIRESLLPRVFEMGERVVEKSLDLFGGLVGPFCLETVVTDQLEFKVFEISARIVAGTNPYVSGSPYSDLIEPGISTGRRIAKELRLAATQRKLAEVCS